MALLLHTYSLMAAMNSHVNPCGSLGFYQQCQIAATSKPMHPLLVVGWSGLHSELVASRLHRKCILIVKICADISSKNSCPPLGLSFSQPNAWHAPKNMA